jgi:hypothetical protein
MWLKTLDMSKVSFNVGSLMSTDQSRLAITRPVMWSTLTRKTSTLTLHPERCLLVVVNEQLDVPLHAHP